MKNLKSKNMILLLLGFIAFNSSIYIIFKLNFDFMDITDKSNPDFLAWAGYLFILLFHILAIFYIIDHFRREKKFHLLRNLTLIIGIISLFATGGEKVLFDEVAREYALGWEIRGEIIILHVLLITNILFYIMMFVLILKTIISPQETNTKLRIKDQTIFTLAQYMGIISGIMGLLHTFSLILRHVSLDRLWIYLPFYFLYLLPYLIIISYWLAMKSREKFEDWYDEKQLKDLLKSALTTLILSVPVTILFLFFGQFAQLYWFPYYLFSMLTLFSASTLYYYKWE